MASLVYTEGFVDDVARVELPSKRAEIFHYAAMLADFPEAGSPNVAASVADEFGNGIRKLAVRPFLIVYEYREVDDAVYFLGLVHQKRAR